MVKCSLQSTCRVIIVTDYFICDKDIGIFSCMYMLTSFYMWHLKGIFVTGINRWQ